MCWNLPWTLPAAQGMGRRREYLPFLDSARMDLEDNNIFNPSVP